MLISWLEAKALPIVLVILALLCTALGVTSYRLKASQERVAAGALELSKLRVDAEIAAKALDDRYRAEEARRSQVQTEALDAAAKQIEQATKDRDAVRVSSARLLRYYTGALAAARRGGPAADRPATGASEAAPTGDLPSNLFSGVLEVARRYVDAAESALTSGEACEREYDALTPPSYSLKGKLGN